jgi:Zn-dependent protease
MNLLLVLPLLYIPLIGTHLALCNLVICIGNLLPLPSSDGMRILRTICAPNRAGGVIPVLSQPILTLPVRLG